MINFSDTFTTERAAFIQSISLADDISLSPVGTSFSSSTSATTGCPEIPSTRSASGFDLESFTSLLLNRLMFLCFLQHNGLLDNDHSYLTHRLLTTRQIFGPDSFYHS